ncbi:unnamed protein product, partial [marine sediment metagenome]
VLQPLVENALYHGIRPKGEPGNIFVSAKQDNGLVRLVVRDDGVGMEKSLIDGIKKRERSNAASGFGLNKTIERLRIFYGIQEKVKQISKASPEAIITCILLV